jgi:hypothetical protein
MVGREDDLAETLLGVAQEPAWKRRRILEKKISVYALRSDVGLRSLSS